MKKSDITLVLIVAAGILTFLLPSLFSFVSRAINDMKIIAIFNVVLNILLYVLVVVFPVVILIFAKPKVHLNHLLISLIGISTIAFIHSILKNIIFIGVISNGFSESIMITMNVLYVAITIYAIIRYILYSQIEQEKIIIISFGIMLFFIMIHVPVLTDFVMKRLITVNTRLYVVYRNSMNVIGLGIVALKAITGYKLVRKEEVYHD